MTRWLPPVRIEPYPSESLGGFLIRYCDANGWWSQRHMADLMQVTVRDVRFQLGDLKELETKLGLAAGTLPLANSRHGEDRSEVEGHTFSGRHFHRHRRICPFCIAETGYQRTYWELTFFNRCHLHGVALKDTCDCGQPLKWTDPGLATCIKCITHDPVAPTSIALPARPFEDWCLKALNLSDKAPSVEKLDGTPVAEAAGMTTALGLLSRTSFLRDRPEVEDAEVLQDLGYELLISGALDALVATVVDSYRSEVAIRALQCPRMLLGGLATFCCCTIAPHHHPFAEQSPSLLAALSATQLMTRASPTTFPLTMYPE